MSERNEDSLKKKNPISEPSGNEVSSTMELTEVMSKKSAESIESYNPFEHRVVAKPTSDFGALAHLLKTSLGSGILAMPMAYKNAGLLLGAIGTLILGIICTHCVQMLVRTSQILSKKKRVPFLTFAETGEAAFTQGPKKVRKLAKVAKIVITAELLLSFILGNTVYVVFMSQSMSQVIEYYFQPQIDIRLYILVLWLPLIGMCMFRNLKSLVPFSIVANLLVVVSFSITLYYIFRDIRPPKSVNLVAPPLQWSLFLCTVIFAIEGIGTVLPIENEMKNPQNFIGGRCGILYISMSIVIVIYGVIGFFGYLEYGENTKGSITLNLPINEVLAQTVKLLIALAIFFTYALQFYVPINMIWNMIEKKISQNRKKFSNIALRVLMVTLTIILSVAVPNLEPIISLVGSICFSMLGLLLPSVVDTLIRWPNLGKWRWHLVKNLIIGILSLIALVSGSYQSINDVIQQYV